MPPEFVDVDLALAAPEAQELPLLPINHRFVLGYHRTGWDVRFGTTAAEDAIVPSLIRFAMQPGTNRIGESLRGDQGGQLLRVEDQSRRNGVTILPANSGPRTPWNPGGRGYIVATQTRDGSNVGQHYCPRWTVVFVGSGRTRDNASKFDAYVAHWRGLGLIPACPPYDVVMSRVGDLSSRLARLVAAEHARPEPTARRAAMARELAAWRALEVTGQPAELGEDLGDSVEVDETPEVAAVAPVRPAARPVTRPRRTDVQVGGVTEPDAGVQPGFVIGGSKP